MYLREDPRNGAAPQTGAKVAVQMALITLAIAAAIYLIFHYAS
jgi:hypothetical protein